MRILVFGGRKFGDINPYFDIRTLSRFDNPEQNLQLIIEYIYGVNTLLPFVKSATVEDPLVFITGMATGADRFPFAYDDFPNVSIEKYPADWTKHGRAAGFIRNQQMIDEGKPDVAIGFPGGNGTEDMTARVKKAGIKLISFEGV